MDYGSLMERLLGFMPARTVFWGALMTMVSIWAAQYLYNKLYHFVMLPWMRKENQAKRKSQHRKQGITEPSKTESARAYHMSTDEQGE